MTFAISKVTTLIEHLHSSILTWNSFLVAVLVLTDSWMIQTVYTNHMERTLYLTW